MQQLLAGLCGNQHAMDAFVQMNAGTISPAELTGASLKAEADRSSSTGGGEYPARRVVGTSRKEIRVIMSPNGAILAVARRHRDRSA
jgi:hypothetical protein